MATQVQFRRGTSTQHNSFTGAAGEVTVNTTNNSLHVHDNTTAGGFEVAKANLSNITGAVNISVTGIATVNSISIGSTQVISNTRQLQNIASLDATTTATIEAAIVNAPNTFTDLKVTGISTLGQTNTTGLSNAGVSTLGNATASTAVVTGFSTFSGGASVTSGGLNVTGIVTATSFSGDGANLTNTGATLSAGSGAQRVVLTSLTSGVMTTAATDAELSYNSTTDTLSATNLVVSGNISVGGTVTSMDVTNVDSVGIITAQVGLQVLANGINITGVSTLSGGVNASQGIDAAGLRVSGITTLGQTNITGFSNSGVSTLGNATATTLVVTGFSTLGGVSASAINVSGIITATTATLSTIGLSAADITSSSTTTTTTTATSIASVSATVYRSAVFQVQAVQGTNYNMTTINVLHDGTETYMTEYGTINQPVGIATFSTDIDAGSLRLLAHPTSISSTTFKVLTKALDI